MLSLKKPHYHLRGFLGVAFYPEFSNPLWADFCVWCELLAQFNFSVWFSGLTPFIRQHPSLSSPIDNTVTMERCRGMEGWVVQEAIYARNCFWAHHSVPLMWKQSLHRDPLISKTTAIISRCSFGTPLLSPWSNECWQFDLWLLCLL